jgi:hypothetical protein
MENSDKEDEIEMDTEIETEMKILEISGEAYCLSLLKGTDLGEGA